MNEENKNTNQTLPEASNQNQSVDPAILKENQQVNPPQSVTQANQPTNNIINQPSLNQAPESNQQPIINQPTTTTKEENQITENNQPSLLKEADPANNHQDSPNKDSNKSLILVGIFFTIMFVFIMFLPTINGYLTKLKEKQLENQIVDPKEDDDKDKDNNETTPGNTNGKEAKVVCTSEESTTTDLSSMHITYTYTHIDDKIKKVEKNIIYTYETDTSDNFIEQKRKCNLEITTNSDKEGYNASCKLDENIITVTESFDLTTFKTFVGTNGTTISPVTELDSSLKEEVEELTNQGYKCE